MELFEQMKQEGILADSFVFVHVLNACAGLRVLEEGKRIHLEIVEAGFESDAHVSNSLVNMYSKCGRIEDAWRVFNNIPKPDVVGWTSMISGCVKCGQEQQAIRLFHQMQEEEIVADCVTFVGLLNACARLGSLNEGRLVHKQITWNGCESDIFVGSSLVDMYAKCGSIEEAWKVFTKMHSRDVVAWNAMILGYIRCGQGREALKLFQDMQVAGVNGDSFTFVGLLNACASLGILDEGRCLHKLIVLNNFESDIYVGNSLVDMYVKCGSIEDAWKVFNNMPRRDVISWTAMILGYAKCGQGQQALNLFQQMQQEGVSPDSLTFVGVLNACASLAALDEGRYIHEQIIQRSSLSDIYVGGALVDMYAKCGSMEEALRVFVDMPTCDVVGWTAMILGYGKSGQGQKALELFSQMQLAGVDANSVTFVGLLNTCSSLKALDEGRRVHEYIIRCGLESDSIVGSSLVDMYSKCGSIVDARRVFDKMPMRDVVGWNSMILGYVRCGQVQDAFELFQQMQAAGLDVSTATFVGLLNACASLGALDEGRFIHNQIIQTGSDSDVLVGTSLVDMYVKCGSIDDAESFFKRMPRCELVGWNAMIVGYVKCGQGYKAFHLFQEMQQAGVEANSFTFVGLLNACASLAALQEGRRVHEQVIQYGCEYDIFVANSLVDMYAKCGSIEDAWRVFNGMPTRNVVGWNAMIGGYAMHGEAKRAFVLFEQMCRECVEVNEITFLCLLSACSHAGQVDQGLHYFESMTSVYGISPKVKHYTCMVDLLGRADRISDAVAMVKTMSVKPDASVWMSLLAACRIHGNLEMGELAAQHVLELDPDNSAGYVLLSNIYAASGQWDKSAMIQRLRLERGVQKQPGCSWIEVNNKVHSFIVDDSNHPQILQIWAELKRLTDHMVEAGYIQDIRFALHDEEVERKVFHLCCHSEKLAIAYGLLTTPAGAMLRVVKNLRVCGDCHNAIKFISKIMGRTIIVRDSKRFHHFQDGLCSCGDYW